MASERGKLVEDVAKVISGSGVTSPRSLTRAEQVIALIAERTKEPTSQMLAYQVKRGLPEDWARKDYRASHAASALWPSHGTDGTEEK